LRKEIVILVNKQADWCSKQLANFESKGLDFSK